MLDHCGTTYSHASARHTFATLPPSSPLPPTRHQQSSELCFRPAFRSVFHFPPPQPGCFGGRARSVRDFRPDFTCLQNARAFVHFDFFSASRGIGGRGGGRRVPARWSAQGRYYTEPLSSCVVCAPPPGKLVLVDSQLRGRRGLYGEWDGVWEMGVVVGWI